MTFQVQLVRKGTCPQCGAPLEFASGAAPTHICKYCRSLIVRTDRDFRSAGKVADLVPMATPFGVDARGALEGRPFRVAGRVQYDRVQAPGAPWEEMYVEFDQGGWSWLAYAQGQWLFTTLYAHPLPVAPPSFAQANPGVVFPPPGARQHPQFAAALTNIPDMQVTERGQRRFVSAEGELPFPMVPNQVEPYADLQGQGGTFATIDFDRQGMPAHLYFGRVVDRQHLTLASGAPFADQGGPRAQVTALVCPTCGGSLPLAAPDRTERIACKYCGTLSDVNQGHLVALKQLPLPNPAPAIALGSKGTLRGAEVQVLGYMIRKTHVDGEEYSWREYLLFAGGAFVFLMEEDGEWQYIVPVHAGDSQDAGQGRRAFRGEFYTESQTNSAVVDSVAGEFYWRVEAGEQVNAREYKGPRGQKLNEEWTADEIQLSHSTPLSLSELTKAFGTGFTVPKGATDARSINLFFLLLLGLWLVVSVGGCVLLSGKVVLETDVPVAVNAPKMVGNKQVGVQPAPAEATFSEPFSVPGGKNMKMFMRAGTGCLEADDAYVTADVALVHVESGEVMEDSVNFSDYEEALWYSRLPEGQYVLRVDPDANVSSCKFPIHFKLVSGQMPFGYVGVSFVILGLLWLFLSPTGRRGTKKVVSNMGSSDD